MVKTPKFVRKWWLPDNSWRKLHYAPVTCYSKEQIKSWVNDQRESGKKRTYDNKPFQFNNLELVEREYKKKRANGAPSSCKYMYHPEHLYGEYEEAQEHRDPDEWSTEEVTQTFKDCYEAIFPNFDKNYYKYSDGRLFPWHEVKACNGIIWKYQEAYLSENADKCSYVGRREAIPNCRPTGDFAIPTRGNCKECGGNGALGEPCINKCI